MREQTAYRIIEMKQGEPHTLFHGINGSRRIHTDRWIKAKIKPVRDGTGPYYTSGFNVLLDRQDLENYMGRFTKPRDLRIVEIKVRGELRRKEHSPSNVWLADEMYLPAGEVA